MNCRFTEAMNIAQKENDKSNEDVEDVIKSFNEKGSR